MATQVDSMFRARLGARREKLEQALEAAPDRAYLAGLIGEVDAALARLDQGSFGLCETCNDPIEEERLIADPLIRFCLDHLTPIQQQALQQDLELAAGIQSALLPKPLRQHHGWNAAYHYEAAGPVSGDYCDLVAGDHGNFYFMLGDVSGKGVAASMLMAHLHAVFRTLIGVRLPLGRMVEQASRVFCESTLASQFATLICGKASPEGSVEICNAGHLPPLVVSGTTIRTLNTSGLPLGMFCSEEFPVEQFRLSRGDQLILFTDGIPETRDPAGRELGTQALIELAAQSPGLSLDDRLRSFVDRAASCRGRAPLEDDISMLVVERTG